MVGWCPDHWSLINLDDSAPVPDWLAAQISIVGNPDHDNGASVFINVGAEVFIDDGRGSE
jgi:hypothetical protein